MLAFMRINELLGVKMPKFRHLIMPAQCWMPNLLIFQYEKNVQVLNPMGFKFCWFLQTQKAFKTKGFLGLFLFIAPF